MTARPRRGSMWMAPTGQTGRQLPQATHLQGSIRIATPPTTERESCQCSPNHASGGISRGASILFPPLMRDENNAMRVTPRHARNVLFMAETKASGFSGVGAAPGFPEED